MQSGDMKLGQEAMFEASRGASAALGRRHAHTCLTRNALFTAAMQELSTFFVTTRVWRGTMVVHVRHAVLRAHSDREQQVKFGSKRRACSGSGVRPNTHLFG